MDNTTTGVAFAAASSPWWLDLLRSVSEVAALVAPPLGVVWIVVQIWAKIKETKDRTADE